MAMNMSDETPGAIIGTWAGYEKDRMFTPTEGKNAGKTYVSTVVYLTAEQRGVRSQAMPIKVTNEVLKNKLEEMDKKFNGKKVTCDLSIQYSFGKYSLHLAEVALA